MLKLSSTVTYPLLVNVPEISTFELRIVSPITFNLLFNKTSSPTFNLPFNEISELHSMTS